MNQATVRGMPFLRHVVFLLCVLLAQALQAQPSATPAILLAGVARPDIDPAPYLVSEKYDGVRAVWDGQSLRTRAGNVIAAPAWFSARLPKQALDGELWIARGQFEKLSGYVRKATPRDDEWRQIKYMIFELPGAAGSFAERYEQIQRITAQADFAQLIAVEQFRLADNAALKRKLAQVVRAGGEGLMLHRADAPYTAGRSDALLKLKPLDDAEATVIGHVPGKGKYQGKLGALQVETAEGKRFQIGTGFTDATRANPPPVGSQVTYTYNGVTKNGLPRFASFVRVRDPF